MRFVALSLELYLVIHIEISAQSKHGHKIVIFSIKDKHNNFFSTGARERSVGLTSRLTINRDVHMSESKLGSAKLDVSR